jgi:hypothetical protein
MVSTVPFLRGDGTPKPSKVMRGMRVISRAASSAVIRPSRGSTTGVRMRNKRGNRRGLSSLVGAASIAFAALVCSLAAHAQRPARVVLPGGQRIEVLGFRRWTLDMLQDSLAKYAPRTSLASHACAATLRYTLGFADAGSWLFVFDGDTASQNTVVVREPQDSARVRFRVLPSDTARGRPEWRGARTLLSTHPALMEFLTSTWPRGVNAAGTDAERRAPDEQLATDSLVRFLRLHGSARWQAVARRTIDASPNWQDRVVAIAILSGSPQSDASWHALLEAVRDADDRVNGIAAQSLDAMSKVGPRAVDWRPVATGIHALLEGTSLFQFTKVADVLMRTSVGPRDARAVLRGGGDALLEFLSSEHAFFSRRSRSLLTQLRGADLGPNPDAWREWIASL